MEDVIAWLRSEEGEAWSMMFHDSRRSMGYTLRSTQAMFGMFTLEKDGSAGSASRWTPA